MIVILTFRCPLLSRDRVLHTFRSLSRSSALTLFCTSCSRIYNRISAATGFFLYCFVHGNYFLSKNLLSPLLGDKFSYLIVKKNYLNKNCILKFFFGIVLFYGV